ncbi:hypothetical protein [Kitasatospora indigofera]|uniref:hypothetical protein n=1 Tax=Kitasatospora indigofera TaxID=67307 RepID=UPI00368BD34E
MTDIQPASPAPPIAGVLGRTISIVPVVPAGEYSYGQLHETACIACRSTNGPFTAAGHVSTEADPGADALVWAVVTCPPCSPKESAR